MGYEELLMAIPTPIDMTEQPFRAYRDNAKVRELVSKFIFLDPSLDFYIYNPLEVITALLSGLELALGEYLIRAVK